MIKAIAVGIATLSLAAFISPASANACCCHYRHHYSHRYHAERAVLYRRHVHYAYVGRPYYRTFYEDDYAPDVAYDSSYAYEPGPYWADYGYEAAPYWQIGFYGGGDWDDDDDWHHGGWGHGWGHRH